MAGGYWRIASGLLLVPAAVAGLSGCSNGPSTATASMAKASSDGGLTAAQLRGALLTRVNGVAAAAPASSGRYSSLTAANTSKNGADAVRVTPKACAAAAGFNPAALAASPAAAVTFKVGSNEVSEVLIASSAKTASTALAAHIPAECAKYEAKVGGKTYTYGATEQKVTGIGQQAKVLNVQAAGVKSNNRWSLIYRGKDFVGTVTVVGPNASKEAVTELGRQAYAYAVKTLS
ncbi:MAG TPA: hypothetical protein VF223_25485 [Trebonia sp.]